MKEKFEFNPIYFQIDATRLCDFCDVTKINNSLYELNTKGAKGLIVFNTTVIDGYDECKAKFVTFYCDTIDSFYNVISYLKDRLYCNSKNKIETILKLYTIDKEYYLINKEKYGSKIYI